ncbi:MAG: C69 family dipeptidase, partial [Erysipelotrichaceae bacterium]|nr:C69 family dipeptidase [Erysipelotrichaceae bacterium]
KYVLSSHYQTTEYDPYSKLSRAGAYRVIGVPNSDVSAIMQIRPYVPDELKGIMWLSLGGSGFTALIPQYVNVDSYSSYISGTTKDCNTNNLYWNSRLIAALIDAQFHKNVIFDERYIANVLNESYRILDEYDAKMIKAKKYNLSKEANEKIIEMLKKKTTEMLNQVLATCSESMKTRYHRGDN